MYKGILHTHYLTVTIFLLIYVIKTILLLSDKTELLAAFSKRTKILEMVISVVFLLTGIYLATQLPFKGKFDYLFWIKLAMIAAAIPIAIIGFKKTNKILAALSLLLLTGSFGIAEVYSKKKGIPRDSDISAISGNDGKALYEANCVLCHGNDGKLGLVGSKDLTKSALDIGGIREIILHGKGNMPKAQVNEEQAGAIADYVKENIVSK